MVYGISGKLGGGKSYTAVRIMLQALSEGHSCISNIRLKDDYLKKNRINASRYTFLDDFGKINPWSFPSGDLRGSGGTRRQLIVVDEAGEWLDSYADARGKTQLAEIASWLRQSDKLGQDVYFIVQFDNLLHARLRNIVHRWLFCTDLAKFRLPLFGMRIAGLTRFIVVASYDRNELISRQFVLKSPRIWEAYDTAAFFGNSYLSSAQTDKLETTGKDYYVKKNRDWWPFALVAELLVLIVGWLCA